MDRSRLLKGLTFNIVALGFTSLLTDVSSEMIFALLPFFMANVLGIQMALLGLIEGTAEAASSLLKAYSGWLSDKIEKRKPFAALGYSISTVAKPLFAFATAAVHVFTLRILDRIGKGVRTSPRDALIADSINVEVRGKAYGLHRSMDTLGATVGPLLAYLLLPVIGFRGVFSASVIPGIASVMLLLFLVKEAKRHPRRRLQILKIEANKWIDGRFKAYVVVVFLFTLGSFSYAFFLLRAVETGIPIRTAPLLYLLFNTAYAASAFPVGTLADKIGKRRMLTIGYISFGFTCLGFAVADYPVFIILLFVAYGVSYAVADTLQRAVVPDLVEAEVRGSAFGILHTATGLAALPSSFIAGSLWQLYGAATPFTLSAVLSMVSAVIIATILYKR